MNGLILDPLAMWGRQDMTRGQMQNLIAAAPDLLALLIEAAGMIRANLHPIQSGTSAASLLEDIDAALAKATGGAQ